MELKLLFSMIVVIMFSSWVSLSYSQLGVSSMPCIQKLLPCQPYLTSPSSPPSSCCLPLKEMITDDSKCLCDVFNNPELLKSLNLTQEDALKLPKACGAVVDLSVCKTDTTPPTTPSTPSTGSPPGSKNTTTSSTSKISLFGGYGFLVLVSSLFIPVF